MEMLVIVPLEIKQEVGAIVTPHRVPNPRYPRSAHACAPAVSRADDSGAARNCRRQGLGLYHRAAPVAAARFARPDHGRPGRAHLAEVRGRSVLSAARSSAPAPLHPALLTKCPPSSCDQKQLAATKAEVLESLGSYDALQLPIVLRFILRTSTTSSDVRLDPCCWRAAARSRRALCLFPAVQEDCRSVVAGLRANLAFESIATGDPKVLTLGALKDGLQFQQRCATRHVASTVAAGRPPLLPSPLAFSWPQHRQRVAPRHQKRKRRCRNVGGGPLCAAHAPRAAVLQGVPQGG